MGTEPTQAGTSLTSSAVAFHEGKAAEWSSGYRRSNHFRRRARDWQIIIDGLVRPGNELLDVGCGSGDLSLMATLAGARVTCADGSPAMLAEARRTLAPEEREAQFVQADVRDLPFGHAVFDVVLASSLLEYVTPLPRALGELRRVCRLGGMLACSVPNPRSLYRWAEGVALTVTGKPTYRQHVNPAIYRLDFPALLGEAGFEVIEAKPSGAPPFLGTGGIGDFAERSSRFATMTLYVARAI